MNRRITVLQTGALPLGYVTKFVCPNIITEEERFVKPFLKLFQERRNFIYERQVSRRVRSFQNKKPAARVEKLERDY